MDTVLRALAVYVALLIIFRISGRRALSEATTFDLILTLIISEAVQQGMVDDDHSLTSALLLVITLVTADVALSYLKARYRKVSHLLEGTPLVIVEEGKVHEDRMAKERVDRGDLLEAAREQANVASTDGIRYAVLEVGGTITVVPKSTS
jgi:uncharacterized membrane protein YcaP (DUF421 family)